MLSSSKEVGVNPYPHKFQVSMTIVEYVEKYGSLSDGEHLKEVEVSLAGRDAVFHGMFSQMKMVLLCMLFFLLFSMVKSFFFFFKISCREDYEQESFFVKAFLL